MTKLFFASDLHGCVKATEQVLEQFKKSQADQLILLGDLLYHGPRNPVPADYNPAQVAALLNQYANKIIAVRGNCDSEVDQMLCQFPIMSDYAWVVVSEKGHMRRLFLTHGHLYQATANDATQKAPLFAGDILCHGHTHIPVAQYQDAMFVFNPGSTTFPRQAYPASYGLYHQGRFGVYALYQDDVILETDLAD